MRPVPGWPVGLPEPVSEQALPGGMIGSTAAATLADGREAVIKRCPYPAPQEARALRAIADTGAPVPAVWGVSEHVLVLERVGGSPDWAALGRSVALMHRSTADRFGWPEDTWVGLYSQPNDWADNWPTFYTGHRVLAHLHQADLPDSMRHRIERACAGPLIEVLRPDPVPSMTHGDLWSGNIVDGGWLIDPSASFGDREMDVAGFSAGDLPAEFLTAYQASYPTEAGFEYRRSALTLHRKLVNLRHFGPRIVPQIEAVLDEYGW